MTTTKYFPLLIIVLTSVIIGMVIALLVRSGDKYHGPNAAKVRQQIFYDPKTKQCVQFDIRPVTCPKN